MMLRGDNDGDDDKRRRRTTTTTMLISAPMHDKRASATFRQYLFYTLFLVR